MATELISLGILFFCAVIGGIIATKFKQPAVFGLLLVGAIIGPHSFNIVADMNMITMMADFGAILLLFVIGLEFDFSKLAKTGARSLIIGLLKFAIVLFLGFEATMLLGFGVKAALFMGVILSFSSTVVIVKVLEQKAMFSRKEVPLLVAILVIEDIIAVLALTFFSGMKDTGSGIIPLFEKVIFATAVLVFAYFIIMKLLKKSTSLILKNNTDESVFAFLSLGLGALFSYFAFYLGLTPSAGAFLAGSLIASLPNSKEYGKAIHPYALIFTAIFFISMGTLVDFDVIRSNIPLIGVLIAIIFISRFIAIGFLTFLLANFKNDQPFFASIAMMSIGEFSLLVAKESKNFNVGIDLVTITAAIIFLSAIMMSIGINYSEKIHSSFKSRVPLKTKFKLDRISGYMRGFFDQMEIETFFTKKLRIEIKSAFMNIVAIIFLVIILRRLSVPVREYSVLMSYAFYAVCFAAVAYSLKLLFTRLKSIHHTLSVILTNVDSSRNMKKCTYILNNLLVALSLLFAAMLFPFAMFALNLGAWSNFVPIGLMVVSVYYFRNIMLLIEGVRNIPSYNAGVIAASKFS
ncbi:MAG TPA: cation:proton antiporter [Candidatus Nanoarchaeia archaeon]|nr:cation:proton antiporter [Candidatus Nanoarchaeia archaeon]